METVLLVVFVIVHLTGLETIVKRPVTMGLVVETAVFVTRPVSLEYTVT